MAPKTLGFIGLGNMGGPLAAHLIKAGHTLVVCDASDAMLKALAAHQGHGIGGAEVQGRKAWCGVAAHVFG